MIRNISSAIGIDIESVSDEIAGADIMSTAVSVYSEDIKLHYDILFLFPDVQ